MQAFLTHPLSQRNQDIVAFKRIKCFSAKLVQDDNLVYSFDTETTGLDINENEIISIQWQRINGFAGESQLEEIRVLKAHQTPKNEMSLLVKQFKKCWRVKAQFIQTIHIEAVAEVARHFSTTKRFGTLFPCFLMLGVDEFE
jgi:uncharacterized protein YprB with RNaseH-like and TPR domain